MLEEQLQIYWYSGLYLQPQHFQSIDLHHGFMLARYRQLSQSYNHGFYECIINNRLLNEFTVKIDKIKAILPSGYYLEYPGNCTLTDKCLSYLINTEESSVNLWLSLKRFNSGHVNVACSKDKRGSTRWVSSDDEIIMRDVYHESQDTGITRIKYDVQIITDEEKECSTDCEFLPLVKVLCENNALIVDKEYSFPALRISANPLLREKCTDIFSELLNYKKKLEEYRYTKQSVADGNFYFLLILYSINRTLPMLTFSLNEADIHPWLYHMALRQLAGEISTIYQNEFGMQEEYNLTYKHFDQISCFNDIHDYLEKILNGLCCNKNKNLIFSNVAGDIFFCNLGELSQESKSKCFIKLTSSLLRKKIISPASISEIKIAPADYIDLIIQHALPGIPLDNMDTTCSGLPKYDNTVLLNLDICSDLWKEAKKQGKIAFYWSGSPEDLVVELILSNESEM
ncbi:type VI secretion system baseplate subunit TssK [Escherichia coli]|uniref:type VI secretion system baseplate subunit TssK n=2 Tax=Escherichia coli TaxID=562 RepID=UPI0012FDDE61|nr:type VI secretion system baseplate subunit TssK [Escherichia coli]EER0880415.1 type VI secretion system baseplate subunit TssK [Escherichia coli]EJV3517745.1 type VI secretion system baseplate subunit TssK [Escherichia coli]MDO2886144.1 type VI secretion system baseplate subunit TssK [Escherichia coli]MVW26314.1 type VI secretion system baseplate subunit TssK [Escherichia coli]HAW7153524.1 type VI secretion system baseplate subunit TssK [Escherichia coli]